MRRNQAGGFSNGDRNSLALVIHPDSSGSRSSTRRINGSEVSRQRRYTAYNSRCHDDERGESEGGLDGDRAGVVKHLH